jgi:serine protease Do
MADTSQKYVHRVLLAGAAASALFAGFAAAPAMFADRAEAQQIVIKTPQGAPLSFADLIQRVSPAVVSIEVTSRPAARSGGEAELPPELEEFLRRNGIDPERRNARPREATSLGSGFFIDSRGTIVTNHHVVDEATDIKVKTNDGKTYTAELVGSDQPSDVAVLRLRDFKGEAPFVAFSKDTNLRVGDWVVAVGNPFGLQGTATAGIVSALGRRDVGGSAFVDFIQVDAPINRGNSGGPTFDLQGRVIGVNSAIISPTGGSVGIGFAIPAATAERVVTQLLSGGKVSRGWLGVEVQVMDDDLAKTYGLSEPTGALVANVREDGPARKAGLRPGDLIVSVDGQKVENQSDLTRKVGGGAANRTARLEVLRQDGQRRFIDVRLGERPSEQVLANADPRPRTGPNAGADSGEVRQSALGLGLRPMTPEDRRRRESGDADPGMVITQVEEDSDLFEKGVRSGQVLVEAGGAPVRTVADVEGALAAARKQGVPLRLLVRNERGQARFIAIDVKQG